MSTHFMIACIQLTTFWESPRIWSWSAKVRSWEPPIEWEIRADFTLPEVLRFKNTEAFLRVGGITLGSLCRKWRGNSSWDSEAKLSLTIHRCDTCGPSEVWISGEADVRARHQSSVYMGDERVGERNRWIREHHGGVRRNFYLLQQQHLPTS